MNQFGKTFIWGLSFFLIINSFSFNYIRAQSLDELPNHLESNYLTTNLTDESSQVINFPDTEDGAVFQEIMTKAIANNLANSSIDIILQTIATEFLGAEYQAGLLDNNSEEQLVVSLTKFDCLLFVETVLALSRNIILRDYNYDTFTEKIEEQRYLGGEKNGYCSRLHYFSGWVKDNQQKNIVQNITSDLGGIFVTKKLNFMTAHRGKYAQLINNNNNYQCIAQMEGDLDGLALNYIPTNKISSTYHLLKPGDIIGIATKISGLDVTHTGLVYSNSQGNIGFIHASPGGKVVIAHDLQNYVAHVNNALGIVVVRAKDSIYKR